MQHVRELGQCEHDHLERYDHGEEAEQVDCLCRCVVNAGDIPRAHGAAQNDQGNRRDCDEQRVTEGFEEACLVDCICIIEESYKCLLNTLDPSVIPSCDRHIADAERVLENVGFPLKRVQDNDKYR